MAGMNKCINTVTYKSATSANDSSSSNNTNTHKSGAVTVTLDTRLSKNVQSVVPKRRQDVLKWYGWGYKDTHFYATDTVICFKGDRYPLGGNTLPLFTQWVLDKFNIENAASDQLPVMPKQFPEPTVQHEFLSDLKNTNIDHSLDGEDRFIRCHGQTLDEIFKIWHNKYKRIPDMVVWPHEHADVEQIIALANKHNVVVIPYGGGTSVSGSITCPQQEQRMICVVDTSQMTRMLWLNRENLTVCFEAGITGQDLERELRELKLTVGHEPDSYEFSTLGGWVATRASGMKKNVYGNIEDLVVRMRMVTAAGGVLERECTAPRVSNGPDFNHVMMGSEGTLGIITEVVLKVRPQPAVKRYGSLAFPNFECGMQFMREVARRRCQPASVRLMDNEQFKMGQSMSPPKSWFTSTVDYMKKAYVTTVKGIDLNQICAATLLFEGEADDVHRQEVLIYEIAKQFKGFPAGGHGGERGYILTFVIAYMRDFALQNEIFAESFETSMPWDRCSAVCRNVKRRVEVECQKMSIKHYLISCRVTQTYDAGACVYFYFAFKYAGMGNPVATFEHIENSARDEILAVGGSLSHHHGVGKIRSQWYAKTVSPAGRDLYLATKRQLDPKNIFALGNLLPEEEWQQWQQSKEQEKTKAITNALVKAKL